MASAMKNALIARAAKKAALAVKGGNGGKTTGYTFANSGRSAAYRNAASKVLRQGKGAITAHKAGLKADRSLNSYRAGSGNQGGSPGKGK